MTSQGPGRVKEGAIGISPLRLHVTDRDVSHSPAWRARFTIHGDKGSHFTIQTDPDSNDGILEVVRVSVRLLPAPHDGDTHL